MALNVTPATWLGNGYSTGAGTIIFSTAQQATPNTNKTLPKVDDKSAGAESAPATGDIRRLLFGLIDGLYEKWLLRVAAAALAPTTDPLPTKMTIYKSTSTNDTTGEVTRTYSFQFKTEVTGEEVASET